MNKFELDRAAEELSKIAGNPYCRGRAMELVRALLTHYKGEDKPKKDENQLELQFKDE